MKTPWIRILVEAGRKAPSAPAMLLLALAMISPAYAGPVPSSFFRDGVPDFDQHEAGREDGGNNHCAPTAAANSFTWFDHQGYDIVPDAWDDDQPGGDHDGLIDRLATDAKTNRIDNPSPPPTYLKGTTRDNYVKGLRRYLRSANNNSLHQFDVKFQGSGYNGYTVGSQGDTVSLDWIKSEISSGEDVMLHIGWYLEASPGVLGPRQGGHVVTLDGYTSTNKLLIRDPFYAEGIIEPDSDFAGQLVYTYSTASNAQLRAKIEGVTTVSPKPIIWDGLVRPSDYALVTTNDPFIQESYLAVYRDYVSIGLDQLAVQNPVAPSNPSSIIINPQPQNPSDPVTGFLLQFDNDNTQLLITVVSLDLSTGEPTVLPGGAAFDNDGGEFQLTSAFGPSDEGAFDHSQVELFVDREVFGEFAVDSFFDIWTEIDPDGAGGEPPIWDHFSFVLDPQLLYDALAGGAIDPDPLFAYLEATTNQALLDAEVGARLAGINSTLVPEPSTFVLLFAATGGFALCVFRRRRDGPER